jgi:hypothetical protein
MAESNESVLWKQSWAPAYIWESLVRVRQFCLDAIHSFFTPNVIRIGSSHTIYSPDDPRSGNCLFCRSNLLHDCLFFDPKLATLIIDIIEAFGKTKLGSTDYVNAHVIEQVITRLPTLYEHIGHPTNNGYVWRCVQEKLILMFPDGVFMMEDISSILQNEYVADELNHRRECHVATGYDFPQQAVDDGSTSDAVAPIHISPESDLKIMCGCKFYSDACCPMFDKYIHSKKICRSSLALQDHTNCQIHLDLDIEKAQMEVEADWNLSPICVHFRIHKFLGELHHKRSFEVLPVKSPKDIVIRKQSVTKYKSKGKHLPY